MFSFLAAKTTFVLSVLAITISFDPSPDDKVITAYNLYWGTNSGGPYPYVSNVGKSLTNHIDNTNFLTNVRYYFVANAYVGTPPYAATGGFSAPLTLILTNTAWGTNVLISPSATKNVHLISIK